MLWGNSVTLAAFEPGAVGVAQTMPGLGMRPEDPPSMMETNPVALPVMTGDTGLPEFSRVEARASPRHPDERNHPLIQLRNRVYRPKSRRRSRRFQ